MNKLFIIGLVVGIAALLLWQKYRPFTRIEKIDWLNVNKGNAGGLWVQLQNDELDTVFKVTRLQAAGMKPEPVELAKVDEIFNRYAKLTK